ncbi:hypothetical protein GDO78_020729 [Eleutherodactylus coqui]|uniref:Protein YIPF n=1 Tax=Eleutherodactylus coqui TaxID=57060 RepID=A0A8J6ECC1_ELECQ|nr:hypothetical protein GDO78_020729 [Eleutherodactylus coqui]
MAETEEKQENGSKQLFAGLSDVSISGDIPVEGEITVPMATQSQEDDFSTLDEPVRDTIMRDLKAVGQKFFHVLFPKKSNALLRDCNSFFQSLCVLGYCILPLTVAMLVCRLLLLANVSTLTFTLRLVTVAAMFAWSTFASTAFLADSQPPNRRALAVYPIFLFYFVISWMILTFNPSSL